MQALNLRLCGIVCPGGEVGVELGGYCGQAIHFEECGGLSDNCEDESKNDG